MPFHRAEISLAGQLLRAAAHRPRTGCRRSPDVDWAQALAWLHRRTGADLAPEQEQAVRLALTEKVAVLTGGPGCGKSFTVRSIVDAGPRPRRPRSCWPRPTGRAAKRLAELTGTEAATVHRLLELRPGGDAAYDRDRPLDADLVVVDEASMLDLLLANKLVKAVAAGRAPAASSGTSTSCRRSAPGRCCATCSPPAARARGAADPDLPAGPGVRGGDQRAPDQRRGVPAAHAGCRTSSFPGRGRRGRRGR